MRMEISKESWAALIEGQIRDRDRIQLLNNRLRRMAKQVEKLSMQLEGVVTWVADEDNPWTVDSILTALDNEWKMYQQEKSEQMTPYV